MSNVNIDQLLHQMRQMAAAAGASGVRESSSREGGPAFEQVLGDSIRKVNELQQNASDLAAAFEKGDPNVDLAEVMVELQKASVSFTAMTEVRNKLLSAYQDIMNMQV